MLDPVITFDFYKVIHHKKRKISNLKCSGLNILYTFILVSLNLHLEKHSNPNYVPDPHTCVFLILYPSLVQVALIMSLIRLWQMSHESLSPHPILELLKHTQQIDILFGRVCSQELEAIGEFCSIPSKDVGYTSNQVPTPR